MAYTPFNKEIRASVTEADLAGLIEKEVAEGYYIEYKEAFPEKRDKIARTIASFANTYGGWYFVGIKADKLRSVAVEICGIDLIKNADPISQVREIIKSNIDPIPVFHPQLVVLQNGRAVLVIHVPDNQATPFVTKDGRVYRRVNDSSDPVPENKRYTVDQLVQRGREVQKEFELFCVDERGFAEAEKEQGWVKVFISPHPLGLIRKEDILFDETAMAQLIALSQRQIPLFGNESLMANIPFNSCHPAVGSIILHQKNPGNIALNSLSAQLFVDGRAKFYIPLPEMGDLTYLFQSYSKKEKVKETLQRLLTENGHMTDLKFFDVGKLWFVVGLLMSYYFKWLRDHELLDEVKVAIVADGIWKSVPFADAEDWAEYVDKFGLPIIPTTKIRIPTAVGGGVVVNKADSKGHSDWMLPMGHLIWAFGLQLTPFSGCFGETVATAVEKFRNS